VPQRFSIQDADFATRLRGFIEGREQANQQVGPVVAEILHELREKGDAALLDYTRQFDRFEADLAGITVTKEEIAKAVSLCSPELMKSLKVAAARIRSYSEKQLPEDLDYTDEHGIRLGHQWTAIQSVGLYVPGGLAAYPSSVLMNAIPALAAGVERLVMVVPAPGGELNPALLGAAHVAGIEEIYKVGGAQAIGALAYGTASIRPVDKIVGPGNAYVAEAKRQVFGRVGIDMIAGPSEILVVADNKNDPAWIAADLLSQCEHDKLAQAILVTDDAAFADAVCEEAQKHLDQLERQDIAQESWDRYGGVILVQNWEEACAIVNTLAPEHLELAVENPDGLMPMIVHAGAIFLGRHTPEALGDYIAGPSHVLPTSRTARFSSGLSVFDFLKRSSIIGVSKQGLDYIGPYAQTLAESEGLGAHALSVSIRRSES
jgi:histidinol dehydrogenase